MKCNFCNGKKDFKGETGTMFMQEIPFLSPEPRLFVWIGNERAVFRVKYCPMCGKRLEDV